MNTVTIGMPVYNGERFIGRALTSLLRQSFQDFRIIVSDNASTDGTVSIVEEIASHDSRVTLIRQTENLGAAANFMLLPKMADTPFFMWAAADDRWSPDWLFYCVRALTGNLPLGFTSGDFISCDEQTTVRRVLPFTGLDTDSAATRLRRFASQKEAAGKANMIYSLFRTEIIRDVCERGADIFSQWGGDMALVAMALEQAKYAPAEATTATLYKQLGSPSDVDTSARLAQGRYYEIQFGGAFPPGHLKQFTATMTGGLVVARHKRVVSWVLFLRRLITFKWQAAQKVRNFRARGVKLSQPKHG